MNNKQWKISDYNGHSGTLYYDLIDDAGMRTIDCWIVENTLPSGRVFQFVQTLDWKENSSQRHPLRATLDEAKADAAMFFAKRELERHE